MASVFGAKGDIEADLKTLGSGEAISLPLAALWTTGGRREGQGRMQARRSVPRAHDTLWDWFCGGAAYKMNKRPDKCLACDREEIKAPIA